MERWRDREQRAVSAPHCWLSSQVHTDPLHLWLHLALPLGNSYCQERVRVFDYEKDDRFGLWKNRVSAHSRAHINMNRRPVTLEPVWASLYSVIKAKLLSHTHKYSLCLIPSDWNVRFRLKLSLWQSQSFCPQTHSTLHTIRYPTHYTLHRYTTHYIQYPIYDTQVLISYLRLTESKCLS